MITCVSCPCSALGTSRWMTKEEVEALLVENISTHDVRADFLFLLFLSNSLMLTRVCVVSSPVRSPDKADGAPAGHALLRRGGGVRPALPPATGGPVREASSAAAGEGREGRGLQHGRGWIHNLFNAQTSSDIAIRKRR